MIELGFKEIYQALVKLDLPKVDLVVGIADGGVIPASLIAYKTGCNLRIIKFNYRDQRNKPQYPEPVCINTIILPPDIKSILLVDDVAVSGKTLAAAKRLFNDRDVTTMVFKGKADYTLFSDINDCVQWPWEAGAK